MVKDLTDVRSEVQVVKVKVSELEKEFSGALEGLEGRLHKMLGNVTDTFLSEFKDRQKGTHQLVFADLEKKAQQILHLT